MLDESQGDYQRRWNRVLPSQTDGRATITDSAGKTRTVRVLDESVLGLAVQTSIFDNLLDDEVVELTRQGKTGPAIVRSVRPYGAAYRVGLEWIDQQEEEGAGTEVDSP